MNDHSLRLSSHSPLRTGPASGRLQRLVSLRAADQLPLERHEGRLATEAAEPPGGEQHVGLVYPARSDCRLDLLSHVLGKRALGQRRGLALGQRYSDGGSAVERGRLARQPGRALCAGIGGARFSRRRRRCRTLARCRRSRRRLTSPSRRLSSMLGSRRSYLVRVRPRVS